MIFLWRAEVIPSPSPNHDERPGGPSDIRLLVLHYTGMRSGAEALARLCNPTSKVSAHYVVEEDGRVFALVPETRRAWHAGVSSWRGVERLNDCSIGIEIVNPGHEFGYRPFPEAQMQAVIGLCKEILTRHAIPPQNIVGHSDIAPARKEDPGELFDWARLAAAGIGLFPPSIPPAGAEKPLAPQRLAQLGYKLADVELVAVIRAFQRRYLPHTLSGKWSEGAEMQLVWLTKHI